MGFLAMRRTLGWCTLAWTTIVGNSGCGSTSDSPEGGGPNQESETGAAHSGDGGGNNSGTGATSADGGAPANEGGAPSSGGDGMENSEGGGSLSVSLDTELGACRAYAHAQCVRALECRTTPEDRGTQLYNDAAERCVEAAVSSCPAALFSAGSPHTIESALACTEVWKTFDCDALLDGELPDCTLSPGDREDGESCLFQSQCKNDCFVEFECGHCLPRNTGEECDEIENICPGVGSYCSAGTCKTLRDQGFPKPVPDPAGMPPTLGEACTGNCEAGSFCARDTLNCEANIDQGQPCYQWEGDEGTRWTCGGALHCDGDDLTCQPGPDEPGDPCWADAEDALRCGEGLSCEAGDICRAPGEAGEPCLVNVLSSESCAPGLRCVDEICHQTLAYGESGCSNAGYQCETGTRCDDDTCVIDETADPFAELCSE